MTTNFPGILALLLALASSASALVISTPTTWTTRTGIHNQTGHFVQVDAGGSVTANARVDIDGVDSAGTAKLILNGGNFTSNVEFQLPDNGTGYPCSVVINEGTFQANSVLFNNGGDRKARMVIGGGSFILNAGFSDTWLTNGYITPKSGYKLIKTDLGGGAVKIYGKLFAHTPDPDGSSYVPLDKQLSWQKSDTNADCDVFFGTNSTSVTNAIRLPGDFDGSRDVNIDDLVYLASWWLQNPAGSKPYVDLINNQKVNLLDFSVFAGNWQEWAQAEFKGSQAATTFNPGPLLPATQYYWREPHFSYTL